MNTADESLCSFLSHLFLSIAADKADAKQNLRSMFDLSLDR